MQIFDKILRPLLHAERYFSRSLPLVTGFAYLAYNSKETLEKIVILVKL